MMKAKAIGVFLFAAMMCVLIVGCDNPPTQSVAAKPSLSHPSTTLAKKLTLDLGDGVTLELVRIPAGKFMMGSPEDEEGRQDDEGLPPDKWVNGSSQVNVTISKDFYLGVYEVTVDQYAQFVKDTGTKHTEPDFRQTGEYPVVNVSWDDAHVFCQWLTKKTGRAIVLPTEAQWEYACRAGIATRFCFGDEDGGLCDYGNYCDKSNTGGFPAQDKKHSDGFDKTAPVGSLKPNAWGLYDMHGNVWEWCADFYGPYNVGAAVDPAGPATGRYRVVRGGSWYYDPGGCRSAFRYWCDPGFGCYSIGFRVAVVDGSNSTQPASHPATEPSR